MAYVTGKSGSFTFGNSLMTFQVNWSETYDIGLNASKVSITSLKLKSDTYSGQWFPDMVLKINGSTVCTMKYYSPSTHYVTIVADGKYKEVKAQNSGTNAPWTSGAITHNTDGKKSITISVAKNSAGEIQAYRATDGKLQGFGAGTTKTIALTDIPRAATITSAPNFDDEDNPVIKYSNPAGSAATSLEAAIYSSDGSKAYAAYRDISKTGTSYTFSLTNTERNALRNAIPNSKSMNVRFYVRTVIGGNTFTNYSTQTLSITNANPTINPVISDTNAVTASLTGDTDTLIRYFSNAAITFGAAALKGASVKSRKVTCGSASITADGTINEVESGSFKFTVTDSRGFSTTKTVTKPIVNYVKLTCGLSNSSFTTDGVIKFRIKGNYFNGSFGVTSNVLIVQYRYKLNGGSYGEWIAAEANIYNNTYSTDITISGLDYREKYVIQARAIDELDTINSNQPVMSCIPVFDWSAEDFNFNVNVSMANNMRILATTTDGQQINAFQPANTNNNLVLGYGGYDNAIGATHIYGDTVRLFTNNGLELNNSPIGENRVLWSGKYYMTEGQTANLSQAVSKQFSGIILVFSRYDIANSTELNEHFSYHFVPKQMVALQEGKGSIFNMNTSNETFAASKYLYISDDKIEGHANNDATGTGNTGVTYNNNRFVLRYVIGV